MRIATWTLLLALAACSHGPDLSSKPPVRFGLLPARDAVAVRTSYLPLAKALEDALQRKVELVIPADYDAVADAVVRGDLQLAQLSAYLYARVKNAADVVPLVQERLLPDRRSIGAIVVKADSSVRTVLDLKDKRIAWVDRSSSSGYYYQRMLLRAAGMEPDAMFGPSELAGTHEDAIKLLELGRADAAAVALRTAEAHPQVRLLVRTEVIPDDAIVALEGLSEEERLAVRRVFVGAGKLPALNGFMQERGIEAYVPADASVYVPLEREMGLSLEVSAKKPE